MRNIGHLLVFTSVVLCCTYARAQQVDYAFIPGTGSVNIPHGPGLRANSQFSATITVANQSPNQGNVLQSVIRYELVPNFGGPFLPTTRLRWRAFPNSPLLNTDPPIRDLATPNTNFVFTTLLSVPPGITPGNYSLRAILDPDHIQNDSNRANNTNIIHNNLTVLGTPDLTFRRANPPVILNPAPNDIYQNGDEITVRVYYENVGDNVVVQPFDVDFYLGLAETTVWPSEHHVNSHIAISYFNAWSHWDPQHRHFLGRRTAPGIPSVAPAGTSPLYSFDATFTLPNLPSPAWNVSSDYTVAVWLNAGSSPFNPTNQVMEQSYHSIWLSPNWQPMPNNMWWGGLVRFSHLIGQGPDLRMRSGTQGVSPSTVAVGDPITVSGTVENVGTLAAPASKVRHYLLRYDAVNQIYLDARYVLGETSIGTLSAPIESAVAGIPYIDSFTVPPTVPSGTYRYLAHIDPEDQVAETNRANNTTILESNITVDGSSIPDLAVSSTWTNNTVSPWTVTNKSTFTTSILIRNLGFGDAGPFGVRYYLQQLSGDEESMIVGPPSAPLGSTHVAGGLAAKSSMTLTTTLDVPEAELFPPGSYRLVWEVDFLNQVLEVNTNNNTAYWGWLQTEAYPGAPSNRLVVVNPDAGLLPDMAPFEFSFGPSEIGVGKNPAHVTFTNWIQNIGTAASPAFSYQIYLTPDPDPSTTNLIFKASRPLPAIHAGDRAQDVVTIALPETFPVGIYYPVMIIDGNNNVVELDKSNNKIFYGDQPLIVTAQEPSERPILDVINFNHSPTERIPGQPFHYQFTLVNNGVLPMAGLMVDVALNYDGQFSIGDNDRILVEHGPFDIPGEGGSIDVSGSLVFDEPTLPNDAYRVIWGFNRREPGVDTQNGPIHITRDVTVRTLNPRLEIFPVGMVAGTPIVYLAFRDSYPGRLYQVQRSMNLNAAHGGFNTMTWGFPPGDPSTTLLYGPFNLGIQPGPAGVFRVIDVTPE